MKSNLKFPKMRLLVLALLAGEVLPAFAGSMLVRGDFNNDGSDDIVIIRDGTYSIRGAAATGGVPVQVMTFNTSPLFLQPDTAKVVDLDQDGFDDVLLASRSANRLLVISGQTTLANPYRTAEFSLPGGPVGADAAQFIAGGTLEIVSPLNALPQPNVRLLSGAGLTVEEYPLPQQAAGWSSVDVAVARLLPENSLPQFAWLSRGATGSDQIWWTDFIVASPGAPPIVASNHLASINGLNAGSEAAEFSPPRFASGRLLVGTEQGQWVLLPSKTNALAIVPANVPAGGPVVHRESLDFVGNGGAVLPDAGGDLIVVTAADGTFARLLRWNGPGNLVIVETISAPTNHSLLHAVPLNDGNLFMTLSSGAVPGSWTAFACYNRTGSAKGYSYLESLPRDMGDSAIARVMVFDRDPFGGDALEWESFSLGGWAFDAEVQSGKVLVEFQPDVGLPGGLGEQELRSLTPRRSLPSTAVALANQWEPDSSVFFGAPPGAPGGADVSPQPPPGNYSAGVNINFATAQNVAVHYRLGNGIWRTGRGPVEITKSTTVEYYGVTPDGYAGPIRAATYAINEPADLLPGSLRQDNDRNGLDDAWERLFFGANGVDPEGDNDNDQFTNREEYQAGTNPRDALSYPPGQPGSGLRVVASVSSAGRFQLRLESDFGSLVTPEYSTNLLDWLPLPGTPETLPDGSRVWSDSEPVSGTRFYRFSSTPN